MSNLEQRIIKSKSGKAYQLVSEIGHGAQGVVYSESSGKYLVKLFTKTKSLEPILIRLNKLMSMEYPPRFIKPIDIIEIRDETGKLVLLGYVMVKVIGHISLNKLLIPPTSSDITLPEWYNVQTGGLKRRLYLAYQIAMNFYLLHRNNIAYCDISGNNILVAEDVKKASVCMIDIDNLYYPGYDKASVLGTSRYMAPEIINNQMQPDVLTDDYSLAVIIFELLKCGHPFIGDYVQNSEPEIEEMAFRGLLPYIEDPENDENRSSNVLPNDAVFNEKLKKAFEKTFIHGIKNRMERTTALEWAKLCLEASNALIKCEHDGCHAWHYPNNKITAHAYKCPWCDKTNDLPDFALVFRRYPHYKGEAICSNGKNAQPISTIILQENVVNIISDNYVHYSVTDNSIANTQTRFDTPGNLKSQLCVAYLKNGWMAKNLSTNYFYLRKGNSGPYIDVAPNQEIDLRSGDAIYVEKHDDKDDFTYTEMVSSNIKPITFIRFNFW